jgi:succinate dehydrogenase/fumarate reductase flavoprotein subunit
MPTSSPPAAAFYAAYNEIPPPFAGEIVMTQAAISESRGLSASLELDADVLVLGGGPAGTWAALTAVGRGAKVVLADKGYCGTSGATAPSGTGVWYVDPDPAKREAARRSREVLGGYLVHRDWGHRVLDQTYLNVNNLADWGYPFPLDEHGVTRRTSLQGPEYMRMMRRRVQKAGIQILDHSPALELLLDEHGTVAGAAGVRRQEGGSWLVRAKAVIVATGGCAFLSGALGTNVLTGDGFLMAAEAGADLSGMEFSNAHAICTTHGSVTKTLFYSWATFTYQDGTPIPGAGSHKRSVIATALLQGPVYAQIDRADAATQASMRASQPNFFLPLDRAGIDPFTQRFPITLRAEGTIRGTGGLRIRDASCATSVAGLYAAGDAATRELICGAFTGGGSHNAAWAMSSGSFAGEGAAEFALSVGKAPRHLRRAGGVGLQETNGRRADQAALVQAVQNEIFPYQRNYFRTADGLTDSLSRLDDLWRATRQADAAAPEHAVRAREAAAMLATARWMYRSALARPETRGMHKRLDHPELDSTQRHHLISGGLDEVWVTRDPVRETIAERVAA